MFGNVTRANRSETGCDDVTRHIGTNEDAHPSDERAVRSPRRPQVGNADVADDYEPDKLIGEETERPTTVRPDDAGEIHGHTSHPLPAGRVGMGEASEASRRDPTACRALTRVAVGGAGRTSIPAP